MRLTRWENSKPIMKQGEKMGDVEERAGGGGHETDGSSCLAMDQKLPT